MKNKLKYWLLCSTCVAGTVTIASEEDMNTQFVPPSKNVLSVETIEADFDQMKRVPPIMIDLNSLTKRDLYYPMKPEFLKWIAPGK